MEPTKENVDAIVAFVKHCVKEFDLPVHEIKLRLLTTQQQAASAGAFNPATMEVFCCIKNRAIADIMRTIAHELTHAKQLVVDKVEFPEDDEGLQPYEDEANSSSGRIVRFWGRKHPEIYADLK